MEKLNTEDGQLFVKNLASFVRTHERALANALQLKRQPAKNPPSSLPSAGVSPASSANGYSSSTSSTLATALSFGTLRFTSQNIKPAKLTLTPHHLFYLLSRFEELSIPVGPMNVRLENIHTETAPGYVSFLSQPRRSKGDRDSIHSVSSVRSVMSGMSIIWSSIGLGSKDPSKSEKAKAALETDLKYLYSAFTKIPCLRLAPDHRARLIRGYEEFPFDTAVPLHCFKNLSALEIIDIDFRSFFGWDRLSEQLRTLTLKRANIDDPADLLTGIVLDDIDKRRRRSTKVQSSPILGGSSSSNLQPFYQSDANKSSSVPGSPTAETSFSTSASPQAPSMIRPGSEGEKGHKRTGSMSPIRPTSAKQTTHRHSRGASSKLARSGSGSSNSSDISLGYGNRSSTNLIAGFLPPSKWRFLRHLSLADNSLTSIAANSLTPVANTLHSLDLCSNLFAEVPDSLASLVALRALNLSNCMIHSLRSLSRNPLPAITALNLRGNRLHSIAGIERLLSLERLDLRDNNLSDPMEIARLTGLPEIREIWVSGNPFTKTHPGYRVTIFNLFRQSPGYSEDIIIDTTGPGYSERKQLVDRVAEPEAAPVVRPTEPDPPLAVNKVEIVAIQDPHANIHKDQSIMPSPPETPQSEYAVGTGRRRRVTRRRIVDLSREDSSAADDPFIAQTTNHASKPKQISADPFIEMPLDNSPPKTVSEIRPLDHNGGERSVKRRDAYPPEGDRSILLPAIQGLDFVDGDLYRQRLQALKHEVGSSWLTVLGDATGPSFDPSPTMRPDPVPRTRSQIMVSGGRTLG